MAAWASSRRPARRSICATPASTRSTRARTASRRSTSSIRKLPLSRRRRRAPADRGDARNPAAARQGCDAGLRLDRRAAARGDREPRSRDELHAEGRLRQPARGGARRRDAVSAPVCAGAGRRRPRRGGARCERRGGGRRFRSGAPGPDRALPLLRREHRDRARAGWRRASSSGRLSSRMRRSRSRAECDGRARHGRPRRRRPRHPAQPAGEEERHDSRHVRRRRSRRSPSPTGTDSARS